MHTWTLYLRLLGALVRSQLQYRMSFVMDLLSTLLYTLTEFGALMLVLGRVHGLGSWTVPEIILLYGMSDFAFNLMDMVFAGFDPLSFGGFVRQGSLDQLLLRPASLTVQVMGSDFGLRRLGKVLLGLGLLVYGAVAAGVDWTPEKLLLLLVSLASLVLFFAGLYLVGSTLTFFTIDGVEGINLLTYGGRTLISYPMDLYQDWLRKVFTFGIPAVFLSYFPALHLLNKPNPFHFPDLVHWLAPVAGLGTFGVGLLCWRLGLKHYQGTGT